MTIHFSEIPATFINIPKTGTTSFKEWSIANIPGCEVVTDPNNKNRLHHLNINEIKERWGTVGTTFTFVRNPYDRVVSLFHHVGQTAEERIKKRKQGLDHYGLKAVSIETDIRILSIYKQGFNHWILNSSTSNLSHCPLTRLLTNIKNFSQVSFLSGFIPDIIVKIENIDRDFIKIQDLLKCNAPPLHSNKSNHLHYREYYTDATRNLVSDWFRKDLELFDYSF